MLNIRKENQEDSNDMLMNVLNPRNPTNKDHEIINKIIQEGIEEKKRVREAKKSNFSLGLQKLSTTN